MMTASRWLRVAAREFRFDAMGTSRSYLEFYLGFGYVISVLQLAQAVLLWQLAGAALQALLALKAIAHARPAPLRIGIFRMLVKVNLL
jgi:hypothetical protein